MGATSDHRGPLRLEWSGNDEADRLIATDPVALLIGFCLDQQITVQQAFTGPLLIRERLGTLDPRRIARLDPGTVESAFRAVPAVHRYPASMARRVQRLCSVLDSDYGGDAARVWREARDGRDLLRRFGALPGFGPLKASSMVAVVGKHFGVRPPGWEDVAPGHPTLGDVATAAELASYQEQKRAHKARMRAAAGGGAGRSREPRDEGAGASGVRVQRGRS